MDVIFTIVEVGFVLLGVYCLVLAFRSIKKIPSHEATIWRFCGKALLLCFVGGILLFFAGIVGGREIPILILMLLLPFILSILALSVAIRCHRKSSFVAPQTKQMTESFVRIAQIVTGRVRGYDGINPIYFSDQEEADLLELTGHVRLLEVATTPGQPSDSPSPLLGFWNNTGASFLLYHDDDVRLSASPTTGVGQAS